MNANNRDANLHSDWPHYLRDVPCLPHSERSNRHLRRNRKRIVEAVTALFTVDPGLELDDLVVSIAGCHPPQPKDRLRPHHQPHRLLHAPQAVTVLGAHFIEGADDSNARRLPHDRVTRLP